MIISLIFGGLILPVLGVLLNLIDLDLGILKMNHNPQNQSSDLEAPQKML